MDSNNLSNILQQPISVLSEVNYNKQSFIKHCILNCMIGKDISTADKIAAAIKQSITASNKMYSILNEAGYFNDTKDSFYQNKQAEPSSDTQASTDNTSFSLFSYTSKIYLNSNHTINNDSDINVYIKGENIKDVVKWSVIGIDDKNVSKTLDTKSYTVDNNLSLILHPTDFGKYKSIKIIAKIGDKINILTIPTETLSTTFTKTQQKIVDNTNFIHLYINGHIHTNVAEQKLLLNIFDKNTLLPAIFTISSDEVLHISYYNGDKNGSADIKLLGDERTSYINEGIVLSVDDKGYHVYYNKDLNSFENLKLNKFKNITNTSSSYYYNYSTGECLGNVSSTSLVSFDKQKDRTVLTADSLTINPNINTSESTKN